MIIHFAVYTCTCIKPRQVGLVLVFHFDSSRSVRFKRHHHDIIDFWSWSIGMLLYWGKMISGRIPINEHCTLFATWHGLVDLAIQSTVHFLAQLTTAELV